MSLELCSGSRPAFELARPGDCARAVVRRSPHARRVAGIVLLHDRARILLGLAMIGASVVPLGSQAVVPLAVCAIAVVLTSVRLPVRVTA